MPDHAATIPPRTLGVVIVAAGRGVRAGFDKAFATLGGRPVLAHSVCTFAGYARTATIAIVAREEARCAAEQVGTLAGTLFAGVASGGGRRQDSVWNGVQALIAAHANLGEIAVHDAARPLVRLIDIERCHDAALHDGGAVCAAPIVETLRRDGGGGWLGATVPRDGVWAMQTPQIFRRDILCQAMEQLARSGDEATDEAGAVIAAGGRVRIVEAPRWNLKITWPGDLEIAECLLHAQRVEPSV